MPKHNVSFSPQISNSSTRDLSGLDSLKLLNQVDSYEVEVSSEGEIVNLSGKIKGQFKNSLQ